ncbi:MAG: hypothetical protein V3Q69_13865 (plasmid) [Burkholderia sp.]
MTFKCSEADKAEIEARSNGNVSRYIRERLLGSGEHQDLLYQILDRLNDDDREPASAGQELGMLTELLLLMRAAVKPDARKEAQAEVERLGLPVWTPDVGRRK